MSEPMATAEFEISLADLADVSWRSVRRSVAFRRQQLWVTLVLGLAVGALAPATILFTREQPGTTGLWITGAACATALMVLRTLRLPAHYRRAVTRMLVERHGPGPFRCAVELRPEELLVRQLGADLHFPWADVTSLRDVEGDFEMLARRGALVVRARAFATASAREHFVQTARRLATSAR